VTRSAPLGSQTPAAILAAFDISEPVPDRGKTTASTRTVKGAPHFSSVLGGLVQKEEKPEETTGTTAPTAYALPVPVPAQQDPMRFGWNAANTESPVAAAGDSERETSLLGDASPQAFSSISAVAMPSIPSSLGISTLDPNQASTPTLTDSQSLPASVATGLPSSTADLVAGQPEAPASGEGLIPVLTGIESSSKTEPSRFQTRQPGDESPDSAELDFSGTTQAAQPGSKLLDGTQLNLSDQSLDAIQSVISGSAALLPPNSAGENGNSAKPVAKSGLKLSPMERLFAGRAESLDVSVSSHSPQVRYEALERSQEAPVGNHPSAANNLSGPSGLAFTARLVPQTPPTSALPLRASSASQNPVKPREQDSLDAIQSEGSTVDADQPSPSQDSARDSVKSAQPDPGTDTTSPPAPADFAATTIQAAHTEVQEASLRDSMGEDDPTPPAPPASDAEPVKGVEGQEGTPASPARDIQLQLTQGDQRVDVRLSERGGEVRVAVRTPDTQLAGALRDQLPRLSAQLEQTGFRTETWHPAISEAPSGQDRRMPSTQSFSNPPGGGQSQSQQDSRQQQSSRQPKANPAPAAKSSQRKEFAWLMSQLP
jgi:hypothetical protein